MPNEKRKPSPLGGGTQLRKHEKGAFAKDDERRNAENQKIRNLINQRFPEPGANDPAPGAGLLIEPGAARPGRPDFQLLFSQEFADYLNENLFERYAHNAVNVNSRKHRDHMRREVSTLLFNGEPLPTAARAWLIYVLGHCDEMPLTREVSTLLFNGEPLPTAARAWLFHGLGKLKDMPHECKGRRIIDRSEFKNALLEFIIKTGAPIPRGQVVKRLQAASGELNASYEKIRNIYYSKAFQSRLSTHSSGIWSASYFLTWSD